MVTGYPGDAIVVPCVEREVDEGWRASDGQNVSDRNEEEGRGVSRMRATRTMEMGEG